MSYEYQNQWDELWREQYESSSREFRSQPGYAEMVEEARKKGFRPITIYEQVQRGIDSYTWRGGVWVRI